MVTRGIALLFLNLGTRKGWVVSTTPRPPGTQFTGGWVGPRAGLDVCEKSRPHRDFFCSTALYSIARVYTTHLQIVTISPLPSVNFILGTYVHSLVIRLVHSFTHARHHSVHFPCPPPLSFLSSSHTLPTNPFPLSTMYEGKRNRIYPQSTSTFLPGVQLRPIGPSGICPSVPIFLAAVQLSIGLCGENPDSLALTGSLSLSF
jgi:hypothetical protein